MTSRTMEISLNHVFSDFITHQNREEFDSFDLSESAPIIKPLHPKMIKSLLSFILNPEQDVTPVIIPDKHYACYNNLFEAQKDFPALTAIKGLPCRIYENFHSTALYDFEPFGAAVISCNTLMTKGTSGIHQHVLPPLLEYALCQELWGSQGKWTRFHERLHTHFDKFKLLNGLSLPGRYPLVAKAKKLESRGIKGTDLGNSFVLTLPWTFSLSALVKLEAIIQEDF